MSRVWGRPWGAAMYYWFRRGLQVVGKYGSKGGRRGRCSSLHTRLVVAWELGASNDGRTGNWATFGSGREVVPVAVTVTVTVP